MVAFKVFQTNTTDNFKKKKCINNPKQKLLEMCDSIPIAPPKLIMTNNKLINDCLLNISNNYSTWQNKVSKNQMDKMYRTKVYAFQLFKSISPFTELRPF